MDQILSEQDQIAAINRCTRRIMELAQQEHLDPTLAVAALCDTIAYTAVQLDHVIGPQPIAERLHPVMARIMETYARVSAVHGVGVRG